MRDFVTVNDDSMLAAIYARKSTDQTGVSDAEKSVARQIDHGRAYAERKGWAVADAHIYVDDGISGAEFANRPGFVRLMNALTPRPPFQVLVMSEESRLGREQIETAYALKQLVTAGVRVFFYLDDRERTLDTPVDKIMSSLTAFADEFEREKARQRTFDAMRRKAEQGHVTGGRVFGYDNVRQATGGVIRVINEDEAGVVRRIFRLYAEGNGLKPIARQLNTERAPCPRAQQGRPSGWAPSSVREVLHRPLYRGELVWNKTRKRNAWGQTKQQRRPEAEWLRSDRPELRIVDATLCRAADARLARARSVYLRGTKGQLWGRPKGHVDSKYLLPGLARCGVCGGGLYAKSRSHGTRRAFFYGCTSFHQRGTTACSNGRELPMTRADEAVLSAVLEDVLDAKLIETVVARTLEQVGPAGEEASKRRGRLEAALGDVEQEIDRLANAIAAGGQLAGLLTAVKDREVRREALRVELSGLRRVERHGHIDRSVLATQIRQRVDAWRGLLSRQTVHARQLLTKLLDGPMIFTPQPGDSGAWEFTATARFDRLLSGLVDATSVASPTGPERVWTVKRVGFLNAA